jgi:photosystem II stability/assembly factor-like uncharacterized protein
MSIPDDAFTSAMGALWLQINGPNTRPIYAGCQTVDDVEAPDGDIELIRCFDPSGRLWKTVGQTQSPPDPVTTTITGLMFKTASVVEMVRCPAVIHLLQMCGEGVRKDIFQNFDRAVQLNVANKTNTTWSNLVHREEDNASERAVDVSANPPAYEVFNLKAAVSRQSTTETQALNDISICGEEQCAGVCGIQAHELCSSLVAAGDTLAGSPAGSAEVIVTADKGTTWTATAADPFIAGEDVSDVECFQLDKDTDRIIVARGTTDAGNPAEIAYSDDNGATWNLVNVGSVNGQFVPDNDGLFVLDRNNIWLATDDGYIYKSEDAGESWTAQESGIITTDEINCVVFADANVGFFAGNTNIIAKTSDGGQTWSAVTAPADQAGINIISLEWSGRWWIGYETTGELWYSEDEGTNWLQRTYDGGTSQVSIPKIDFITELHGFMVTNTVAPVGTIYHTVDGGYTWQPLTTTTNVGLNSIVACDPNLAYAVGEPSGGTAVILKVNVYPDVS